jgi:hypothetical protein
MTFGYFRPGRHGRLKRIESHYPGPRELRVGGGRTIMTTWEDRYEMLLAAIRGADSPMLDAVRTGAGEPDSEEFAQLLRAIEGGPV